MQTEAFCAMVAAEGLRRLRLPLLGILLAGLAACAGPGPGAGQAARQPLPMRVADAPVPPQEAQSLDDAVASMTHALFDRARIDPPGPSGRYSLVIDPLIDRATGQESGATRGMERRIGDLVRDRYPDFTLKPFHSGTLAEQPIILLGAITAVSAPGVVPPTSAPRPGVYRIWAVLGDLRTGKVVSHETAWVRAEDVDPTPAAFFQDSPSWTPEPITASYLRTCAGNPGDPIDPDYLRALRAQALIADGVRSYEQGNHMAALMAYSEAARQPAGDQLRVRNGIYLAHRALGQRNEAERAFGEVVDYGLERGNLAVKFLFRTGGAAFISNPALSRDYPMWLRQIARRSAEREVCLDLVGHASPTGPAPLNQQLSERRAEAVRGRLVAQRPVLRNRLRAEGAGASQTLIGTGTEDDTDALDRRVEFRNRSCPMVTAGSL